MKAYREYLLFKEAELDFGYEPVTADLYTKVIGEIESIFSELISSINRILSSQPATPVATQVPLAKPPVSTPPTFGFQNDWWNRNSNIIFKEQQKCTNSLELYERFYIVSKELGSLLKEAINPEQIRFIASGIERAKKEILDIVNNVFRKRVAPSTEGITPERLEKIKKWVNAWKKARKELGLSSGKRVSGDIPTDLPPTPPSSPPSNTGALPVSDLPQGSEEKGYVSLARAVQQQRLGEKDPALSTGKDAQEKPKNLGDPEAAKSPFATTGASSAVPLAEPKNELDVFKDLSDKVPLDNQDQNYIKAIGNIVDIITDENPKIAQGGIDLKEIAAWLKDKSLKLDDFAPGGRFESKDAYIQSPDPSSLKPKIDTGPLAKDSDDYYYLIGTFAETIAKRMLSTLNVKPAEVTRTVNIKDVNDFISREFDDEQDIKSYLPPQGSNIKDYAEMVEIGKQIVANNNPGAFRVSNENIEKARSLIAEFRSGRLDSEGVFAALRADDEAKFTRIFGKMNKTRQLKWKNLGNIRKLVNNFYGIDGKAKMASEQVEYYLRLMKNGKHSYIIGESLKGRKFSEKTQFLKNKLSSISF